MTDVTLPDGTRILARGLRAGTPPDPVLDYGLYLGGSRLRGRHDDQLTWPHTWIAWPDFLLPRDTESAIASIRDAHGRARTGARIEIACGGGVGRTGTVLACLAILSGVPATEAVSWVRAHYHPRAVETPWQRRWITRFPAEL